MPRSSRRPAGQRFSATRQPATRRGRLKVSRPGVYDERAVKRLAEDGVEGADLASVLGLVVRLQAEPELRQKFDATVAAGHSHFRALLAGRIAKEAAKGKASALLAAIKSWLPRYAELLTPEVEAGISERLNALIEDAEGHRKGITADAA